MSVAVLWHDLECGGYADDLPLWRELAGAGPVLDLGCGTGRVTLDLAARGVPVTGLDHDPVLLAALRERAAGLPVRTIEADVRDFTVPDRFPLILAPMQTVQLLGGVAGRRALLRCVRAALARGGVFAAAIADELQTFDGDSATPPLPDVREEDGIVYFSRPVALTDEGERVAIHRIREVVDRDGGRTEGRDVVRLDRLTADQLEAEAEAEGFIAQPRRVIAASDDYVGSTVVVLTC